MAKFSRNFLAGRMNKVVDERLLPDGEYIDAMNIRMGSTEKSEIGVIENTKGNLELTELGFNGTLLSTNARCIGALDDSANETIYWFVHDSSFPLGATGKCDMVVSYNVFTQILQYHLISIDDGSGVSTTLNFDPRYLITGVNIIEDLLFWTDDLNQPRFVNVKRSYPTPNLTTYIDGITAEQVLVIKKPPTESPTIFPTKIAGQENFLETRFISFAYRYRYADGEYSATSQWSEVAFLSKPFEFSINSMLNEGMVNFANNVIVNFNSGGPLVKGIDLLFKEANTNVIKVIEKIDKAISGYSDNQIYSYNFSNSKIFTVLPDSELLRLYDNVPLLAKAQTIMGNRLMYGNYVEGYDLFDRNGNPVLLEFSSNLLVKSLGQSSLPDRVATGNYLIGGISKGITGAIVYIDLAGKDLKQGSSINISLTIGHADFDGQTPFPTNRTPDFSVEFQFVLQTNYATVFDLASSPEFQNLVGTSSNIQPVFNPGGTESCGGNTFTDALNCPPNEQLVKADGSTVRKFTSGITTVFQPVEILTGPASTEIGFQILAMQYVDDPLSPTQTLYEYYRVNFAEATFQETANPGSLHSNRGYEIGIVYMDEFGRSTTALVSPYNAVYVPCGNCDKQNQIQVTIPFTQVAPSWAKRYKFVIKPDAENYEIIYSNFFTKNNDTNEVWLLLEGENIQKVQIGDRYVVKKDTSGPITTCAYATVLDKAEKPVNFLGTTPAGIYMKMLPVDFDTTLIPDANLYFGRLETCAPASGVNSGNYNIQRRTINTFRGANFDPANPGWTYEDLSIPAGSKIKISLRAERRGYGNCPRRSVFFDKNFTALRDYDNFKDWWDGDNIPQYFNLADSPCGCMSFSYDSSFGFLTSTAFGTIFIRFDRNTTTNELIFQISTSMSCSGYNYPNARKACITTEFTINRAVSNMVFETIPQDAQPDIFFENDLSFGIDNNGNHLGNVQNQDIATNTPAIIDTGFQNCIVFGNGVESYKIRDSLIGKSFNFGERVTSVSAQEYRRSDRMADITYSGVFNTESNVNKLNEFNFGLLNFKPCEVSFGPIYILDGRETDVLVLQEEKISYVLAGKNLISDSTGGGAIASVPEVLGTQIARTEKYGISFNPESYVHWGFNRFFTDVKRGAVLQLVGDSYSNEQLKVISEANMRTWFRDEFNKSFNTQKLGGYDPYMDEYVLTTNDRQLPFELECINCGLAVQTLNLLNDPSPTPLEYIFCVDLGPLVGETTITWEVDTISSGGDFEIIATYNGDDFTSGVTNTGGSITFDKDDIIEKEVTIQLLYNTTELKINFTTECPDAQELTIIDVVLTCLDNSADTITTQYRYQYGSYIAPLISNTVSFALGPNPPIVSRYNSITGFQGSGGFPPEGSTMTMYSAKLAGNTYIFNPTKDKFKYHRTGTLYNNNASDINSLLNVASTATPIQGGGNLWLSQFTVPPNTDGEYLYLIWDFRCIVPFDLCAASQTKPIVGYDPVKEACCDCDFDRCPPGLGVRLELTNPTGNNAEIYFPLGLLGSGNVAISIELDPGETYTNVFVNSITSATEVPYNIVSGSPNIAKIGCGP